MAPFVHGTWNSTVPKLVFSRCLGKPSTATRHLGPKTGTVFSVRENPSKSPKRPALPGAVNREGAVLRHRPFVLLLFHTLSVALNRAFFRLLFHTLSVVLNRAFFRRREIRCFSAGKDGCRTPEGFSGSEPLARFRTRGPHGPFLGWDGYFPRPGEKLRTQGHTGRNRRDWVSFRW